MTTKKHTARVTILNEEYAIRTDTAPEHARAVAQYLDQAIRKVMSSGSVVESNRFDANAAIDSTNESIHAISDYVRPLLPPAKRQAR
jgi:cell division protein ZapA (FtsZ GTPase activity inhibitor)